MGERLLDIQGLQTHFATDDAERFAAIDREIYAIDRVHHAVLGREMRLQPAYFEQVLAGAISGTILQIHSTLRGSSVSRSPSPI